MVGIIGTSILLLLCGVGAIVKRYIRKTAVILPGASREETTSKSARSFSMSAPETRSPLRPAWGLPPPPRFEATSHFPTGPLPPLLGSGTDNEKIATLTESAVEKIAILTESAVNRMSGERQNVVSEKKPVLSPRQPKKSMSTWKSPRRSWQVSPMKRPVKSVPLPPEYSKMPSAAFQAADLDGNGVISPDEFDAFLVKRDVPLLAPSAKQKNAFDGRSPPKRAFKTHTAVVHPLEYVRVADQNDDVVNSEKGAPSLSQSFDVSESDSRSSCVSVPGAEEESVQNSGRRPPHLLFGLGAHLGNTGPNRRRSKTHARDVNGPKAHLAERIEARRLIAGRRSESKLGRVDSRSHHEQEQEQQNSDA